MRVFAPNAFTYAGNSYRQGWQDFADDSLVRTLNAALLVFLDQPVQTPAVRAALAAADNLVSVTKDVTGGISLSAGGQQIAGRAGLNSKNIGTRILFGRMGTLSNATPKTFHVTSEAACHFDAVRPIFASAKA